jgi:uncharacterized protein YkwD
MLRISCFSLVGLCFFATAGCGSTGDEHKEAPGLTPLTVPEKTYSHGDPTPKEQGLLELMQRARATPSTEGKRIVSDGDPDVGVAVKQFMVDEAKVVADFQKYEPVPPLSFEPLLMQSSKFHSEDMAAKGFQQHDGSAGESFDQRITKTGYKWMFVSENIFAYGRSLREAHDAFLIDWGNPDLGHRHAMLDLDGPERDVGISIVEKNGPNQVGPLVITEDFGMPIDTSIRYVVGVVYSDENGNEFYDPGEGLAGYKVVPDRGDTYAITSTSGGYSIPFGKSSGLVTVQVQSPEGKAIAQQATSLSGENVKVDFIMP